MRQSSDATIQQLISVGCLAWAQRPPGLGLRTCRPVSVAATPPAGYFNTAGGLLEHGRRASSRWSRVVATAETLRVIATAETLRVIATAETLRVTATAETEPPAGLPPIGPSRRAIRHAAGNHCMPIELYKHRSESKPRAPAIRCAAGDGHRDVSSLHPAASRVPCLQHARSDSPRA